MNHGTEEAYRKDIENKIRKSVIRERIGFFGLISSVFLGGLTIGAIIAEVFWR